MVIHTERLRFVRGARRMQRACLHTRATRTWGRLRAGHPIEALRKAERSFGRSLRRLTPLPFVWLRQTSPWATLDSCRLAASQTVEMTVSNSKWAIGSPSRSGVGASPRKPCGPCSTMHLKRLAARRFGADTMRAITSRYASSKNVAFRRIMSSTTCPASL